LRREDASWVRTLSSHVLPLALLPAVAWPVGQALEGRLPDFDATPLAALAAAFGATFLATVASVIALAAGLWLCEGPAGVVRNWSRSMLVAAYAGTPVLLSGALLFLPVLVLASLIAMLHCFALCHSGARDVLGCPATVADGFTAASIVVAFAVTLAFGALCGAAGIL